MTTENRILDLTFPAEEDLTADQYKFVVLTSNGTVRRPDNETEVCIGILQNAPAVAAAADVRVTGISKIQMNDAIARSTFVKAEFVSAADAGKGKTAAAALSAAKGIVVEPTDAEDDLASVLLIGPVPSITDTPQQTTTVTTDSTVGPRTFTAAELYGKLILRDTGSAARADVFPSAAALVAVIPGAVVGSSFRFTVRNTSVGVGSITFTAGAGMTLSPASQVIAYLNSKDFLVVCTNVTSGQEAVTVYSLGTVVF